MTTPRPSKWISPSGLVHWRRLRWWPDTPHQVLENTDDVNTLCGQRRQLFPAPKGARVTCGTCIKAANEKGHLRNVVRVRANV